ncbi:hypothetical protein MKY48_02505 [Paenibacillus sp. FSL W8-0187]|uniref:hypothetical protein n=1 Tax=Paenibacillus sp. FSL W8-0187 TaxID=2921710 RepID=UPI0030D741D6
MEDSSDVCALAAPRVGIPLLIALAAPGVEGSSGVCTYYTRNSGFRAGTYWS